MKGILFLLSAIAVNAVPAPQAATSSSSAAATSSEPAVPLSDQATKTFELSGTPYATKPLVGFDGHAVPTDQPVQFEFAPGQADNEPSGGALNFTGIDNPQPIRAQRGGTAAFNRNLELERQRPDLMAPPTTDHGGVDNALWPMGLSHSKLGHDGRAGWSRQQNVDNIPSATDFAGVDMRLEQGAYRELHWHKASEWALILSGAARIQAVDSEGRTFIDDVGAGDVWFFPSGIPHSIQGLEGGVEFMLVFDDGEFSEDNTFLVSETFAFNPKEVLAKNFATDESAFDNIPAGELFIFQGTDAPKDIKAQNITGSAGIIPTAETYSYHWSEVKPMEVPGGSVKFIDSSVFPIAAEFAAAYVTIKPGAMREMHWHPNSDEWSFFISGNARMTVYAATANARTFDYTIGDVAYIPHAMSHYIENTGTDDVVVLEVLADKKFTDISVGQWLGLTPAQVVQDTLNVDDAFIENLSREKPVVVAGSSSS